MKITKWIVLSLACIITCSCSVAESTDGNQPSANVGKQLLVVDDFGCILRCKTLANIYSAADILISADPDIVALDAASPDTTNYPTKVATMRQHKNLQAFLDSDVDPYEIMCSRIKDAAITFMANVRMNDHHGSIESWTQWQQDHVDWSLGKDTGERHWGAIGRLRQMDYSIEGVRKYRLAIIEEFVDKYDIDGVQLDFGRSSPFVSEPKVEKGKYITEFILAVRKILNDKQAKSDRSLLLGVIVPWDIEFCNQQGLNIQQWISNNYIDYVSPGEWYYSDFNIAVYEWAKLTRGTKCKLYPMVLGDMSPNRLPNWNFQKGNMSLLEDHFNLDEKTIPAFAESYYNQGSDGIMFYNFYTFNFKRFYQKLRGLTGPEKIVQLPRQYFYCVNSKYVPKEHYNFKYGKPFEHLYLNKVSDKVSYKMLFNSDLKNATAVFGFKMKNKHADDIVKVQLNGIELEPDSIQEIDYTNREEESYHVTVWKSQVNHSIFKQNDNLATVTLQNSSQLRKYPFAVWEFEINVLPGQ